jgi:7-carboxy-7-deazaguanine synthase
MNFPASYPNVLPVMEHFYTLQGEGVFAGHAAYFIRLAGCDVGCVWCDVKESWDVSEKQWMSVEEIVEAASRNPARIAVITGGEPLMYKLSALCDALHAEGFRVHIETSGAYPMSGSFDWICVSPKKFKAPLPEVVLMANELKIIVFNKSDFSWAEQHASLVHDSCKLLLQVEWEKSAELYPLMIDYALRNPRWNISVQTHKYLNIP